MKTILATLLAVLALICVPKLVVAQQPPTIGYMFPPGGKAGQTTEVILGGYDWTPDMQLFVHDPRIQLEIIGPPGPVIVPEPPYWFGKKARRAPEPLPREIKARLTIPADVMPGIVKWQAANANGATAVGQFVVNDMTNVVETEREKDAAQQIEMLPVCISGQIRSIREVDHYQFTAEKSGPITCAVISRSIGSHLNAVVEIRDDTDRTIAEAADTAGNDTALTFIANAGELYTVAIYDVDFRGDRAIVYQCTITPGPRVVTAIPSIVRRGETRPIELVGYGIATGQAKLESITRDVSSPEDLHANSFPFHVTTAHGDCSPFLLHISDDPQEVENASTLPVPSGITGALDQRFGEDRYQIAGKKGDVWALAVSSEKTGSQVDAAMAVLDHEGQPLARNDDRAGSTDAEIEFTVPADGDYYISVSDVASKSGTRAATYHLSVRFAEPDFTLGIPELLNVPIGGKATLPINVTRRGGFTDAIDIVLAKLPDGITVPEILQVAANQNALNVELTVAADAVASAALVEVIATASIHEQAVQRTTTPVMIATTIKPPFTIDAEGQDDVTKWPRGSTFPAPVLITRDEGFTGNIVLEMTSKQGRHRQGITAPEIIVPVGVHRILYPVFLPEWLETTRTSRMVVNGVARVTDPGGNLRYSVSRQKTRMGFLPTGALLKISTDENEFQTKPGQQVSIPISINRSEKLVEPITLELVCDGTPRPIFVAEPLAVAPGVPHASFLITVAPSALTKAEHQVKIRATLLKEGSFPVISETSVSMELVD